MRGLDDPVALAHRVIDGGHTFLEHHLRVSHTVRQRKWRVGAKGFISQGANFPNGGARHFGGIGARTVHPKAASIRDSRNHIRKRDPAHPRVK
ncbi:hypothetical protein D3C79_870090 [compost metagenome]